RAGRERVRRPGGLGACQCCRKAFAIARLSDGLGHVDSMFDVNYEGMRAAGMVRGSYQFFRASQDPTVQAELAMAMLARHAPLGRTDLVPALDVETLDGQSAAVAALRVATWVSAIRRATRRTPIVYTSVAFWASNFAGALAVPQETNLWIAN